MLAFIIKRHDYREYDQLISILLENGDRLNVLARGVKKIISKNSAYLEPFFLVEIEVVAGKELDHLIKTSPVKIFKNIRSDLNRAIIAQKAMMILDYLWPERTMDSAVFNFTISWLDQLENSTYIPNNYLVIYLLKILNLMGYQPILNHCINCQKEIDKNRQKNLCYFNVNDGGVQCEVCGKRADGIFINNDDLYNWLQLYTNLESKENLAKISQDLLNLIILFAEYYTGKNLRFLRN